MCSGASGMNTKCYKCRPYMSRQCALLILNRPLPPYSTLNLFHAGPSHLSLYLPTSSSAPRDRFRICASWNMGACVYPGSCSYLHVCFICHFLHRANNCLETPEDSPFKWNAERGTGRVPKKSGLSYLDWTLAVELLF